VSGRPDLLAGNWSRRNESLAGHPFTSVSVVLGPHDGQKLPEMGVSNAHRAGVCLTQMGTGGRLKVNLV